MVTFSLLLCILGCRQHAILPIVESSDVADVVRFCLDSQSHVWGARPLTHASCACSSCAIHQAAALLVWHTNAGPALHALSCRPFFGRGSGRAGSPQLCPASSGKAVLQAARLEPRPAHVLLHLWRSQDRHRSMGSQIRGPCAYLPDHQGPGPHRLGEMKPPSAALAVDSSSPMGDTLLPALSGTLAGRVCEQAVSLICSSAVAPLSS